MVMAANEPYQRVSQDNGPFDGALIGAAIGAGGAGAGVFGARMHYGGVDRRHERKLDNLNQRQQYHENELARAQMTRDQKMENVGPRRWQRGRYEDSLDAVSRMNADGEAAVRDLEDLRHRQLADARTESARETNKEAKREAGRETNKRFNFGYPHESAIVQPEDVRHSETVNNVRGRHLDRINEINTGFDEAINDTRADTRDIIRNSDEGRYVEKVGNQMDRRRERIQDRYGRRMDKQMDHLANISNERMNLGSADDMRSRHIYSRMGGWRNAGIIGASAIVGGGLGMITDGIAN